MKFGLTVIGLFMGDPSIYILSRTNCYALTYYKVMIGIGPISSGQGINNLKTYGDMYEDFLQHPWGGNVAQYIRATHLYPNFDHSLIMYMTYLTAPKVHIF